MRIVSLLPSATEIICELGLGQYLVGVSHECDYPAFVKALPVVTQSLIPEDVSSAEIDTLVRQQLQSSTALYHLKLDVLEGLQPDFIITQSLCEVCAVAEDEVINAVCKLPGKTEIINLEPMCLQDVFDTMLLVGEKTGYDKQAQQSVAALQQRVYKVRMMTEQTLPREMRPTLVFLEWLNPLFNAGHWTPELVEYAGAITLLDCKYRPSTTLAWETVVTANPDILFIACCGFEQDRTMLDMQLLMAKPGWHSLHAVCEGNIYITDGNAYFSRPGPRLVDGLEIMAHALHPHLYSLPNNLTRALNFRG